MIKRMLLSVVCALLILPLAMQAQQKKHTYYLHWSQLHKEAKVMLVSKHIVKIESDYKWSKEDENKSELDFGATVHGLLSNSDLNALGDYSKAWNSVFGLPPYDQTTPAPKGHSSEDEARITRLGGFRYYKLQEYSIYSVEYRYTPRQGEIVTYLMPLPPSEKELYTKGIVSYTKGMIANKVVAKNAGQNKYTYYVYWWQTYPKGKASFISQQIAKIESDHEWSTKELNQSKLDFGSAVRSMVAKEDFTALGDTARGRVSSNKFNAEYITFDEAVSERSLTFSRSKNPVYSFDFRYKPRQGETVTYLNPLPSSDYPLYTKGIIAKKLGR